MWWGWRAGSDSGGRASGDGVGRAGERAARGEMQDGTVVAGVEAREKREGAVAAGEGKIGWGAGAGEGKFWGGAGKVLLCYDFSLMGGFFSKFIYLLIGQVNSYIPKKSYNPSINPTVK